MGITDAECKTLWTAECPGTKVTSRIQRAMDTFSDLVNQGGVSMEVIDYGLTIVSVKILLGNKTQCRSFKRV